MGGVRESMRLSGASKPAAPSAPGKRKLMFAGESTFTPDFHT